MYMQTHKHTMCTHAHTNTPCTYKHTNTHCCLLTLLVDLYEEMLYCCVLHFISLDPQREGVLGTLRTSHQERLRGREREGGRERGRGGGRERGETDGEGEREGERKREHLTQQFCGHLDC